MRAHRGLPALALLLPLLACGDAGPLAAPEDEGAVAIPLSQDDRALAAAVQVPLTQMAGTTYQGFQGLLYPGSNAPPADHVERGRAASRLVRPLDRQGNPHARGKYVLLSIGMSNVSQEFCAESASSGCGPWTFMGMAAADPTVDHAALAIVNGAMPSATAPAWDEPTDEAYRHVRDERLVPLGLSERQVQVVWLKIAQAGPRVSLPDPGADAYRLEASLGSIVRALRVRYPNLRQVFVSSRIYGGYANGVTDLNPEPYAYESGFAVKWVVEAQITQDRTGAVDPQAGPLGSATAPFLAWGPYLWANGDMLRSDGLGWYPWDFEEDFTHPARSGERKVGSLLLMFFKKSPLTRCWFLAGQSCA